MLIRRRRLRMEIEQVSIQIETDGSLPAGFTPVVHEPSSEPVARPDLHSSSGLDTGSSVALRPHLEALDPAHPQDHLPLPPSQAGSR